ncbi:MAG: hypothetical protein SGBAC_000655 [Bacillariaceae sp.]
MSETGRRSRRAAKAVNYAQEQEFSDAEDVFEDSDKEEPVAPTPKRGRPRKSKGNEGVVLVQQTDDQGAYIPPKTVYAEKGYDPSLPPIRERYPFLPEYEEDGSPRIEVIIGRRPVDGNDGKEAKDDEEDEKKADTEDEDQEQDDEDSDAGGGRRRGRRRSRSSNKKKTKKNKAESSKAKASTIDYEYLVKYKNRSYLHLEWKTGADLESMNKSAKGLYRRYLRKLASGNHDEDLEDPNFDPSYAEPHKILAESEQELTLELTDKELMVWEEKREKEIAEESSESESEDEDKDEDKEGKKDKEGSNGEEKKEEEKEEEEPMEEWDANEDVDFSQLTVDKLRRIVNKDGPYYPKIEGCNNPYRDGYITEPPKKPRASYLFFQCTMRSYFAKRNPKATQGELMTIVGEQWNSMSEEEQAPFIELAKEEVKEYEKERALMERAQRPNEMWQPIRRCLMVLETLAKDEFADIFQEPVDLDDFPDYEELIDQPMDLGTIRIHYMSKQFERLYHEWVLGFREKYLRWADPRARPWEGEHNITDAEAAARKRAELGDTPKKNVKQTMYLVKWNGLGYEFCTWETKEDIARPDLIVEYKKLNNVSMDEPEMPVAEVQKVLDDAEHVSRDNAGGNHCIPEMRAQLYAQTRAFQFCKFAMDLPKKLSPECGPKTQATHNSKQYPPEVAECLHGLTYKVSQESAYPSLVEYNKKMPPLLAGEYDAIIPVTAKGLMMNVGEVSGSVAFLGYRQFPDGSKGPAQIKNLIRGAGDRIIAVDGVSTINKTFQEVIGFLRESGKNKFAFMRFLEAKLTNGDSNLTSFGRLGRYATEELKDKFTLDRKVILANRMQEVPEEGLDKEEEANDGAEKGGSDDGSEASEGSFQPDSDEEKEEEDEDMVLEKNATVDESMKDAETDVKPEEQGEPKTQIPPKDDKTVESKPQEDLPRHRAETTHSLAYRLLDVDIGYSSDEGGDEECAFYLDGVDTTFTAENDIPPELIEATEKSKPKGVKDDSKTLPVKKNEFSTLGDRGKLIAAVNLTSEAPDPEDFDRFPNISTAREELAKAKTADPATNAMDVDAEQKVVKRSTVKIEQINVDTNEVINVWANVEAAAATLQLNLNEMRQVLRGEYDEDLGEEIGGFRWQFALAGATVTAGKSESKGKGSKKGKEAWLQFRDRLYDPSEPHIYKNQNKLRDYQVEGVNWLASTYYKKHGCILADEMGLGKTVQIVCYLEHLYRVEKIRRPHLVVVPLSTVEHWRREFEGWTNMVCCVYHDRQRVWRDVLREYEWYFEDRPHNSDYLKFDVLVTTYDTLIGDFDVISQIPFRTAVVDEAHRLRNQKGKLLECMKEISAKGTMQYGFQSRVLMSGTPLQNDLTELWTLLNFIEPFKFPDLDDFQVLYGNMASKEQVEGLQNKISPFMLRRVKEDVAKDIPAKEETVIDVELTSIQKQYYRAIFEHNHAFLNMGSTRSNAPKLMNIQMELRKVCNHPCLLEGVEHREQDRQFKEYQEQGKFEGKTPEDMQQMLNEHLYVMTSGKMVLLDKLLPKLRSEGHKILIFSQMVRMLDLISEYCEFRKFPYERLDGRVRGTERQKSIDRFEREANSFLFLLSTRAGGVGINLTAADVCIIFDSDWNPQNDVQAQARCHRIGQTKDVRIYRLITSRSFEQEMFDRASKKLGLEQAVLGTFDQQDGDDKPTSKEMEQLLKKGAYALLEDDQITNDFCADDIDSILAKRTRTRVVEGTKTASWLNKQGMVVSKSKFTADSKTAGLDMDDPLFWQKIMPDFVTPSIMIQKLEDLSDEIFGTSKKKGKGRGRGRWKRKKASESEEVVEEKNEPIETEGKAASDAEDEDNEEEKNELTRTDLKKVSKFISDLKSMMEGIFDEVEDGSLPSEEKAIAAKLLLTISVKEKLFNEDQRHIARSMLKRLEGDRRRRCRTSDAADRAHTPSSRSRRGDTEIREELRIVKKRKKRRKKGEDPDVGDDGYKVHSDDEADWSDVGEDVYENGGMKISRKEANRRRQWASDADAATAAGRPWPVLPRTMVSKVLGSLLEEVMKIDEESGGVFSVPVPEDDFPEYYEQIKQPMDYGTMKKKFTNGEYRSAQAMQKDFILVMQNCLKFNANDSDIVKEAREQALMKPKLLREAATKHDLFLAEDGSVFEIIDDEKKKGTPKKRRRRRKRGPDGELMPLSDEDSEVKPKKKRKSKKSLGLADDADSGDDEGDMPLSSMKSKKKKTRIKISIREDDGEETEEKSKKRQRHEDDDDEFVDDGVDDDDDDDVEDLPMPKKRGRKSKGGNEIPTKRGGKKKDADTDGDDVDQDPGSAEAVSDGGKDDFASAALKAERKSLGDTFEDARRFFTKRGAWELPSSADAAKFKDVAAKMLSKLSILDRYSIFAKPVDEEEAPGYYEVVKKPIDILAIKAKIDNGSYGVGSEASNSFYDDFLLMFDNCALYNDDDGEVIDEATRIFGLLPETYASVCESVFRKYPK